MENKCCFRIGTKGQLTEADQHFFDVPDSSLIYLHLTDTVCRLRVKREEMAPRCDQLDETDDTCDRVKRFLQALKD